VAEGYDGNDKCHEDHTSCEEVQVGFVTPDQVQEPVGKGGGICIGILCVSSNCSTLSGILKVEGTDFTLSAVVYGTE
jgi:hypothetical protein